jgi:NMD protein affecting ribosome stability and mRNA decay
MNKKLICCKCGKKKKINELLHDHVSKSVCYKCFHKTSLEVLKKEGFI